MRLREKSYSSNKKRWKVKELNLLAKKCYPICNIYKGLTRFQQKLMSSEEKYLFAPMYMQYQPLFEYFSLLFAENSTCFCQDSQTAITKP